MRRLIVKLVIENVFIEGPSLEVVLIIFSYSPCISQRAAVVHYVDKGSILAKVRKI